MKIDGTNSVDAQPVALDRATSRKGANSSQALGTESSEGASFSARSTASSLAIDLQKLPEVRNERVAALREAIQKGQYQISDSQIAGALQSQLLRTGSSNE
jgi:flagellar biosynthesis anti-sigma factor FlgM